MPKILPLSIVGSLVLFAVPTLLMWAATRVAIPVLRDHLPGPDILCWFLAGGSVFCCLFAAAFIAFWMEQQRITLQGFSQRFRLSRINLGDVMWSFAALAIFGALSAAIVAAWHFAAHAGSLLAEPSLTPPFIQIEDASANRLWILTAWLPLFFFNITGEELWWRGYILPRQEQQHGSLAWLVHGAGLSLFHLPLGVDLTIILLPFLFGLPFVVQRRKKLWTGFIVHGVLNGAGFLAVTFGLA